VAAEKKTVVEGDGLQDVAEVCEGRRYRVLFSVRSPSEVRENEAPQSNTEA
jgi:hypothetical protein